MGGSKRWGTCSQWNYCIPAALDTLMKSPWLSSPWFRPQKENISHNHNPHRWISYDFRIFVGWNRPHLVSAWGSVLALIRVPDTSVSSPELGLFGTVPQLDDSTDSKPIDILENLGSPFQTQLPKLVLLDFSAVDFTQNIPEAWDETRPTLSCAKS